MSDVLRIAFAAGIGAVGGALAGCVAAVLALNAKRWRNRHLVARGKSGYRDCQLPIVFIPLCAMASSVVAAVLGAFLRPVTAAAVGAIVPAGLLASLHVGGAALQAFRN